MVTVEDVFSLLFILSALRQIEVNSFMHNKSAVRMAGGSALWPPPTPHPIILNLFFVYLCMYTIHLPLAEGPMTLRRGTISHQ